MGGEHQVKKRLRIVTFQEQCAVFGFDEALCDGVVEELQQVIVEAADVEQADGLRVEFELGPGEDFGELFERAEAAGQGDETVGQVFHECFALVHALDDAQFGEFNFADVHG